ncbi:hypothetical protein HAX54_053005 [Datura stramonium]|uniref:Uncharacterized protein n=1 Tax=Datura stramonium TaxID=4076 RepID=A0ABS8WSW6_DATST|nr:hypothetical protein [Datura stramonium]
MSSLDRPHLSSWGSLVALHDEAHIISYLCDVHHRFARMQRYPLGHKTLYNTGLMASTLMSTKTPKQRIDLTLPIANFGPSSQAQGGAYALKNFRIKVGQYFPVRLIAVTTRRPCHFRADDESTTGLTIFPLSYWSSLVTERLRG